MNNDTPEQDKGKKPLSHVALILHDIRSVINVGSIFRTAEGFGVGSIILSGYTPGPLDRFDRIRQDFHKAALGSENMITWKHIETAGEVVSSIREEGRGLIVLEQNDHSVDIRSLASKSSDVGKEPVALVVGNETEGVDPQFIENADVIVEIPMFGEKESLNVSSATAIALYALFSQAS